MVLFNDANDTHGTSCTFTVALTAKHSHRNLVIRIIHYNHSRKFFKQNVTTIDSITNFLDHIVTIIYYYPINWLIIEQYEILYYYFRKKGTILFYLENFNFSIARWNDSIVRKIEWNQFWKERGKKELFYFFLITFLCKIIYMCVCLIYEMRFQK